MKKRKIEGRNESKKSESNATEDTLIESNATTKNDKTSVVTILKTEGDAGKSKSPANLPQNMAETKREKKANLNSTSISGASMRSKAKGAKHRQVGDTLVSDSQAVAISSDKSKKKRSQGKSAPHISGTESITGAKHDGSKLDCSAPNLSAVEKQIIADKIAKLESGENKALSFKYRKKTQKLRFEINQIARETLSNTGDGNVQNSSNKLVCESANEGKIHDSIKSDRKKINTSTVTRKGAESTEAKQAAANPVENRAEKKPEENDNAKCTSNTHTSEQSTEEARKEKGNAKSKESKNIPSLSQNIELPAKKSKKKRSRKKSKIAFTGTDSHTNVQFDGHKLDCFGTFFDKDVDMRETLSSGIATTETDTNDDELKRFRNRDGKLIFYKKGENIESFSEDSQSTISVKEKTNYNSIRPVIFVTDKSTQTDPLPELPIIFEPTGDINCAAPITNLQEPPIISKPTDDRNSATTDTDHLLEPQIISEPTSDINSAASTTDLLQEPPIISKPTDDRNSATADTDHLLEVQIISEPTSEINSAASTTDSLQEPQIISESTSDINSAASTTDSLQEPPIISKPTDDGNSATMDTDPLPEPPIISEPTNDRNSATTDTDHLLEPPIISGPTGDRNSVAPNTNPLPESPIISKPTGDGNCAAPYSDSHNTFMAYATVSNIPLPSEECKEEYATDDRDIPSKTNYNSNDENAQSIKRDFLCDLSLKNESFEDSFMKCFES